jgi:Na+/H+ antiporter NhaD/arsenite permease-like protein
MARYKAPVTSLATIVFVAVYLGMGLGRVPGLALDRTGVALIGLIVLLASGDLTLSQAGAAVDMPTLALLFALMILSAQFELSGFYGHVAARITHAAGSPAILMAVIVVVTGALSALLTNDVVAFALTPMVCSGLMAQKLDPRPYLVALAAAANAGSAATLIGNPQNILIGQAGHLDFWRYLVQAAPPVLAALAIVYAGVWATWRQALAGMPAPGESAALPPVDRFQLGKGIAAIAALVGLFLTPFPRDLAALAVAGALLLSRRMASRDMIGAADWHLLLLFVCLFGVTDAFARTGLAQQGLSDLAQFGLVPHRLAVMAPLMLGASNSIGNVATIILILKIAPDLSHGALTAMALTSTFAGNLLLTGSLCNIIVSERAAIVGARLGFADFMRSGVPITLASMAAACAWLWLIGAARW